MCSNGLQAPVQPRTPFGELLTYYLKMEPQLFKTAVEDHLSRLKEEKDAQQAKDNVLEDAGSKPDLVLYK